MFYKAIGLLSSARLNVSSMFRYPALILGPLNLMPVDPFIRPGKIDINENL